MSIFFPNKHSLSPEKNFIELFPFPKYDFALCFIREDLIYFD